MTLINLDIKPIVASKLEETAYCHISAFPSSFSSKLGISYVIKMLEWYTVSEDRFLFSATIEDKVIGYIGGAKGTGSTSGMLQYTYWNGIFSVLKRPYLFFNISVLSHISLILRNISKRLFYRWGNIDLTKTKIAEEGPDLSIGLIVIGVNPKYRRKGISGSLLKVFIDKSRQLGYKNGHLSVDTSNTNAIKAYKKNGWEIVSSSNKSTGMKIKIN